MLKLILFGMQPDVMARYGRTGAKNDAKLINKFETMQLISLILLS